MPRGDGRSPQANPVPDSKLHIVIGNKDKTITEVLRELVRSALDFRHDLVVTTTAYVDEFLEIARDQPADLYILVLNNLLLPGVNLSPAARVSASLAVIRHLAQTQSKPILALSGWGDEPDLIEKVR